MLSFPPSGAEFTCPDGTTGKYLSPNPAAGVIGVSGTITTGGASSSLDETVFCNATASLDIIGATTLTLDLTPGPRESDMRITFKVKGQTTVMFRYMTNDGTMASPSQQSTTSTDSYEDLSFLIPGAAQKKAVKKIIVYMTASPGCAVSLTDICVLECVPGNPFHCLTIRNHSIITSRPRWRVDARADGRF